MTGAPLDADGVLAAAGADFVAATRVALGECEAAAARLAVAPDDADALECVRRCVHRLNGSAGTFGFARAGRMAAAVESAARRWLADPALERDRRATVIATFVAAARPLFAGAGATPRAPVRRLWLIGVREKLAGSVATEAAARGYVAERVDRDGLDDALADGAPFALVAVAPAPEHPGLAAAHVVEIMPAAPGTGAPPASLRPSDAAARRSRVGIDDGPAAVLDALERLGSADAATGGVSGTVLILDDDPVVRAVVGVATTGAGMRPVLAGDARAFRAALAAARPALVVVDVELGDTRGLDIVAEVRARPDCSGVPILMLSGRDDPATRESAIAAGASDFLVKPVDVAALAATLTAWRGRAAE